MRFRRPFIFLAMLLAGSLSMTSCVKNYTCQCVIKYGGYPGLPDSVINTYTITNDKTDAQSKCKNEAFNASNTPYVNNAAITATETCILY
jgi:hypothetical protein